MVAVAAFLAALLGAVLKVIADWVGAPIKRQFNYLCCFTSNINNLKEEAKELDDAAEGIQMQVDRALDDVRVILPQVETWLAKSNDIKDQNTTILGEEADVRSGCLKLRARFSLSKRAKKTTDRMKELRDECSKFDVISLPGAPAASKQIQYGKTYGFESRKQIEEDIMTILKGRDMNMLGICGMGGLGKTTMAKRIMNMVLKEHVFEEVVLAVVSQPVDKSKIQLEIGGSLGLKLEEETSEAGRIKKLHDRLSGTKRILLVLDDVWQGMELEDIGIPRDSKSCNILITSRNTDALCAMDVQKQFGLKVLLDEEAWFLFKEKAGTCVDDARLKSIAEEIMKECEGLPIALATVGATLKDEKDPSIWTDALLQLRKCVPGIPSLIAKVYNPLKLSYDFLIPKDAKSLFLLFCLFPEDTNIDVDKLTCFGMGLGIFEGMENLEDVRNRVSTLIKLLKSRSLLLDSEESNDYVRMHDVVRDVCIFIAKWEIGYVGKNNCSRISSFKDLGERTTHPIGSGSSDSRLLFLSRVHTYDQGEEKAFKLDNAIFEGINDLRVLCIQNYKPLTPLPSAHSLKHLKSLILDSCDGLKTLSAVGEFVTLEILICRGCSSITELPLEINGLGHLKLLELTWCKNLQRIGQGIISSLVELEELKMLNSFKRWGSEDNEKRKNVGLRELEKLTNLRCLEIEIENTTLAANVCLEIDIEYPTFAAKVNGSIIEKIKRFRIKIGIDFHWPIDFKNHPSDKRMILSSKKDEPGLGNSIEMQLLRETEYLRLIDIGANSVDLANCKKVRWLDIKHCNTMKNIVTTSMVDDATSIPASLELLILHDLPKLEGICDCPILPKSFHKLKELILISLGALEQLWKSSGQNISTPPMFTNLSSIFIKHCNQLRNLGQLSVAGKDCLPQLQELVICKSTRMKQVFLWNKKDEIRNDSESQNDHCITKVFSKLEKVDLFRLPKLATFYQGMDGFEFPVLRILSISECPKLESLGSKHNSGRSSMPIDDDSLQHLFCQPEKVSFGNLKELRLSGQRNPFCGDEIPLSLLNKLEELIFSTPYGSTSFFSSSIAESLVNLRKLDIRVCNEMLKVIEEKKEEEEDEDVKEVPLDNDSESQSHHCITKVFSKLKKVIKCDEKLKMIEENKEEEDEEARVVSGESGTRMPLILFPKLEKLVLGSLPKLASFCEWKCDIELPLLREVEVWSCPALRIFTMGSIAAAPNLENVKIDFEDISVDTKDLNSVMQRQYMAHFEKPKEDRRWLRAR